MMILWGFLLKDPYILEIHTEIWMKELNVLDLLQSNLWGVGTG